MEGGGVLTMNSRKEMESRGSRGELLGYEEDDEIDLFDIWNPIDRYKWFILGFTAAVCVVVYVSISLMTPVYRSTATLLVEPSEALSQRESDQIQRMV